MAVIVDKKKRRFRMQFSISKEQHGLHQQCLQRAEELGLSIDFSNDFERWLRTQLEQVNRELMQREQSAAAGAALKQVSPLDSLMEELEDGDA